MLHVTMCDMADERDSDMRFLTKFRFVEKGDKYILLVNEKCLYF